MRGFHRKLCQHSGLVDFRVLQKSPKSVIVPDVPFPTEWLVTRPRPKAVGRVGFFSLTLQVDHLETLIGSRALYSDRVLLLLRNFFSVELMEYDCYDFGLPGRSVPLSLTQINSEMNWHS